MTRLFTLLALVACSSLAVHAQDGYYNGLDDDRQPAAPEAPGVRVGIGVGPSIYTGPDILFGEPAFQSDVVATNLGVTGEITFPLSGQLYGRLMGGLLNIGAEDDRPDLVSPRDNPFLTSQTVLAEADLMLYLTPPRTVGLSPYVFTGLSGLFATRDPSPGVDRSALAIPVGAGLELGLSRNVALFGEASYRFGITSVGTEMVTAAAAFRPDGDVCDPEKEEYDPEACAAKKLEECEEDPTLPDCPEVIDDEDSSFDTRFNSGLILGGLRLGFGRAPQAARIPAPLPLPRPRPQPVIDPVPEPEPEPLVCDLVELNALYFDYGSDTLDMRAQMLLDENAELLLANPACCVFIDGYTDSSEGDRFGMGLAGRRAQAVYDYYLSRGVAPSRFQIRNRGVAVPTCDKEDPGPGCERNRRVESIPVDCERFRFLLDNPSYDRN